MKQKIIDKLNSNPKLKEIFLYIVFGGLTTVINYVVFALFRELILTSSAPSHLLISNLVAWVLSVLFAFFTNRKYVFESKSNKIFKELVLFFAARVLSFLLFDQFSLYAMVTWFGINQYIAKLIANIFVVIFNYIASKLVIFKKN